MPQVQKWVGSNGSDYVTLETSDLGDYGTDSVCCQDCLHINCCLDCNSTSLEMNSMSNDNDSSTVKNSVSVHSIENNGSSIQNSVMPTGSDVPGNQVENIGDVTDDCFLTGAEPDVLCIASSNPYGSDIPHEVDYKQCEYCRGIR